MISLTQASSFIGRESSCLAEGTDHLTNGLQNATRIQKAQSQEGKLWKNMPDFPLFLLSLKPVLVRASP
jgi:hypothetical protein